MMLSNKTWDILKWVAQIFLPALASLYFGLGQIWPQLPYPVQVVSTITALDAALGLLLNLNSATYGPVAKAKMQDINSFMRSPSDAPYAPTLAHILEPVPAKSFFDFAMSNETYNILIWIAQYLLPASGTLYAAIATIWSLPLGDEVIGTIMVIDTFLGVLLGISTASYNKRLKAASLNTLPS